MRTRTGRLLAAVTVAGALLAGCGTGPNRVDAAAIVGQDTIPLSEAQPAITAVLTRPGLVDGLRARGGSSADVGRAVVSQLVVRDLLARAAAEQNIVVGDDQVDAAVAQAGGPQAVESTSVAAGGARAAIRDRLIATQLAARELDRLSVTADVAVARSRDEAVTLARSLAAGGAAAEKALSGASTAQKDLNIRPAETPQAALTPLIGVPAGQVAAFPLGSGQGWVVVRVTKRQLDAKPAGPAVGSRLDPQTLGEAGILLLTPTALRTGVQLNPRYGVWDPVSLTAAPDAEQAAQIFPAAGVPAGQAG
ncbi:peptidyl-prolyl cis-trans isomerase [Pseudonocardia phyllosphaerae]|uniref:peptidyl-prolyl cis-trans isomerase n=1 Tax=Pseudonocardia phyllosphaerae TaxID=3390502 RepID=UPI003977F836